MKKILILVVVIAFAAAAAVYIGRNYLVKRTIETGSTYALGVDTRLGSAGVDFGGGHLQWSELRVSNPEGFEGRHLMTMGKGFLAVQTGSVWGDTITVDSLVIDGVDINFELAGSKANWRVVMARMQELSDRAKSDSDRRIKIGAVRVRDIKVNAHIQLPGAKPFTKSLEVKNINLTNVGGQDGGTIASITQRIVGEVLDEAAPVAAPTLSDLKEDATRKLEEEATEGLKKLGESILKKD